ncbi:MAG: class I SAM-dependent methyltransferase [Spirochaetales bacterium]|nr:class I SAM-dependent methyltransferase [Spirochaetales bacterium]
MNIYSLIADEYDSLFPHPRAKTDFVEKLIPDGPSSLLDLGCATGELLLSLVKEERELTGIDLDGEMVARAVAKSAEREGGDRARFLQFEMNSYLEHGEKFSLDLILCFGNTLAYLEGPEELEDFLYGAFALLRPQGQVVIQILNYDNPAMNEDFSFPELHTERVKFARSYSAGPEGSLLFHTDYTNSATGEVSSDIHRLYPFKEEEIKKAAAKAGFRRFQAYGGYSFEETREKDFSRLFLLKK